MKKFTDSENSRRQKTLNMQQWVTVPKLKTRSVLLFPFLLQFSPGHCVRLWRSTAFSLATQSTEMWMCPRPLAASFNSGPSTPTWTVYITTTATETVSITTATPSPATLPQWAGYHIMIKTGSDVTDWRTLYKTFGYGNAAHSGHISDVQTVCNQPVCFASMWHLVVGLSE